MKKTLKFFAIAILICFSFFYTEKVMVVVSNQDPLKMEIIEKSLEYKVYPNQAIVTYDTIIPGNKGREVNVEKSYKKMKKNNVFNANLLVYDYIDPEYILSNNLNKYVIGGNKKRNEVSILFIISNDNYLNRIINVLNDKGVIGNFFVDYKYLTNNINSIRSYVKHNIYSYQQEYTYDTLIISNNIIKRISNNNPSYCLLKEKNSDNLNVCSYSNMNTILPNIVGNLSEIKMKLDNGSMILFDTSINTLSELSYIIDFIIGKGYSIVGLDKLLDES